MVAALQEILTGLIPLGVFLLLFALIFLTAKVMKDFMTPYRLIDELAKKDNPAVGITLAGYIIATAIIFIGVVTGPANRLVEDVATVSAYALLGLVFLNLSRWCLDRFAFNRFCNIKEIVEDRNCGMAAVRFGAYVATGLVAAGSLHGEEGGVVTACVFFLLGQFTLVVFTRIYDLTTPYHLQDEVRDGNVAAGVAFGGTLAALGLVIGRAAAEPFVGWGANLLLFAELAISGVVLLQVARMLMDKLVLTGHDLNREIAEDRNLAAAFVELAVAIAFALVLAVLV